MTEKTSTLLQRVGPHEEWTVELTWFGEERQGPGKLVIRPTDPTNHPQAGLSHTVLREVDFTKALEEMRDADEFVLKIGPSINWDTIGSELVELSAAGVSDEYLARLSQAYCATGGEKPLHYLAGITDKTPAAIKNHLWQATRKGLLIRSPGRRGGQLTEKTAELLERVRESRGVLDAKSVSVSVKRRRNT
ncbi:hypothetical protein MMUR_47870 [Mycolicibacterium murale]|uniref:DNA-binding protein n=1 Tax=Mycolicibacterium murale TaxID=182220 RepID=A0A7I9WSD7_9MYCO|nr:hypothetical protein [Mycolicibacterium murale]MCV7186409.1 hypothetical protein [Mycolicibacterium murale]GFG60651.1 hypothetical protein MMUR_47870 [Mycolicibacterium murale]